MAAAAVYNEGDQQGRPWGEQCVKRGLLWDGCHCKSALAPRASLLLLLLPTSKKQSFHVCPPKPACCHSGRSLCTFTSCHRTAGHVCMLCTRMTGTPHVKVPAACKRCDCNNTQQIVAGHKTPRHSNHSSRPEDCWNRTVTAVPVSSLQHFKMTWS